MRYLFRLLFLITEGSVEQIPGFASQLYNVLKRCRLLSSNRLMCFQMLPSERFLFSVSVYTLLQTCFYPDKISLQQVIALSIHSKIRGVSRANMVI